MNQKTVRHKDGAERTIKDIRRQTRKRYSAEEKIRIVLAGLRGEDRIAELCRREGRAVPAGTYCAEPVLQLVEGVPRGRQEAAGW